jgi:hypothetical protein
MHAIVNGKTDLIETLMMFGPGHSPIITGRAGTLTHNQGLVCIHVRTAALRHTGVKA